MSLYGVLRTGVSGMNAQSTKLSTIADNIANTGTIGYKAASTQFSALVLDSNDNAYNSGAVVDQHPPCRQRARLAGLHHLGHRRRHPGQRFPHRRRCERPAVPHPRRLLHHRRYHRQPGQQRRVRLLAYELDNGNPTAVLNGAANLAPVNLTDKNLQAVPSTDGVFTVNLPANERRRPAICRATTSPHPPTPSNPRSSPTTISAMR